MGRFFIVLSLLVLSPVSGFTVTYYVPDDFSTIQDAVKAAVTGDTIIVRPGTYVENVDLRDRGIILRSEMGAHVTVIDGNRSGPVVTFDSWPDTGNDPGFTLDGFTITNGSGKNYGVICNGGGIYLPFNASSSPVIMNNIITGNIIDEPGSVCAGGGIYSSRGHPYIRNNIITSNMVKGEAAYAGGVHLSTGSFSLRNNYIAGNSVIGENADGIGGGLEIENIPIGSYGHLGSNIIADNFSNGLGGGAFIFGSFQTGWIRVYNNLFTDNRADKKGGALYLNSFSLVYSTNDTFVNNSALEGGGIFSDYNDLHVANSIFWNNQASTGKEIYYSGGANLEMTIRHSDVEGGQSSMYVEPGSVFTWGPGMIDADPRFVDPSGGDYHIRYTSPCVDAGDRDIETLPVTDFEKDPRIAHSDVDIGADEFHRHLYWTGDAKPGGNVELKFVGLPGTSPVQLWLGSGVLDPPMPTKYGDWHLAFPLPVHLGLGGIPSLDGVMIFPFAFPPGYFRADHLTLAGGYRYGVDQPQRDGSELESRSLRAWLVLADHAIHSTFSDRFHATRRFTSFPAHRRPSGKTRPCSANRATGSRPADRVPGPRRCGCRRIPWP